MNRNKLYNKFYFKIINDLIGIKVESSVIQ